MTRWPPPLYQSICSSISVLMRLQCSENARSLALTSLFWPPCVSLHTHPYSLHCGFMDTALSLQQRHRCKHSCFMYRLSLSGQSFAKSHWPYYESQLCCCTGWPCQIYLYSCLMPGCRYRPRLKAE